MSELHQKFDALPYKKRSNLKVGDSVKVCAVVDGIEKIGGERFWVAIMEVEGETGRYKGRVDNILENSSSHGLYYKDLIFFEDRHIYEVVTLAESEEIYRKAREEIAQPSFKNVTPKPSDENQI